MRALLTTYPPLIKDKNHMNPISSGYIPEKTLPNNNNNIYKYIINTAV